MRPEDLADDQAAAIARAISWATRRASRQSRDDLAQDLWVALLRELPNYDAQQSSLINWAYSRARFRLWDILRRNSTRRPQRRPPRPVELAVDDRGQPEVVARGPGPAAIVQQREALLNLVRDLGRSRAERMVLKLLAAGVPQTTAAQAVGISPACICKMVRVIRAVALTRHINSQHGDQIDG